MQNRTGPGMPATGDGKPTLFIVPEKYEAVRKAILDMLPAGGEGITSSALVDRIAPYLPESLFRHRGTVRWYVRAVEIDLEAGGIIERVPDSKPPRIRRLA